MDNPENTTKVEEDELLAGDEGGEEELSLESLDAMIAEEDPDFAKGLEGIGPDDPEAPIYEEGVELQYRFEDELKLWSQGSGRWAQLGQRFKILPLIAYKIKMKRALIRLNWIKFKDQGRTFVRSAIPLTLKFLTSALTQLKDHVASALGSFKSYSILKKISFFGLILATIGAALIIYRMGTTGLLGPSEELFMGSLNEWAQEAYTFDLEKDTGPFYDSAHSSQNMFAMKRLVANLRPSEDSGPNPMGAFEFYVEGTVSEVVVEFKDREPEMQDIFLRTIEEMSFDEVSSGEGKQLLSERLKREVNKVLTKGFVRKVFIKTAIVKP